MDLLKRIVRGVVNWSEQVLTIFGDKLSGPGDFLGCNDFSSLEISCAFTGARKDVS